MTTMNDLSSVLAGFQSTGNQTCFHNRHISPQIYAGLDGKNWRPALVDGSNIGEFDGPQHLFSCRVDHIGCAQLPTLSVA